jgi:hypothetical protein
MTDPYPDAGGAAADSEVARYCRELETYLCRKNSGHLIRIVGPAFDRVCSWAERGVPLKVAFRGIDRYCERDALKRGRRRPVRIEFCEADILEAFDQWRRAIGVTAAAAERSESPEAAPRRTPLAEHIERALAKLRTFLGGTNQGRGSAAAAAGAAAELESMLAVARGVRGEARARLVERLADLDSELGAVVIDGLPPAIVAELRKEADAELAPFGSRLSPDARARALEAAFARLAREAVGVPTLRYE